MNIDEMQVGRELDALIAEKVMECHGVQFEGADAYLQTHRDGIRSSIPHYSTDIAAAWRVVEKLCLHLSPFVDDGKPYAWVVSDRHNLNEARIIVDAPTAPLAICRAALKAVGA